MPKTARPALTDQQQRVYDIIRRPLLERGSLPTLRLICEEMGFPNHCNAAMAHIRPLVAKGYLREVEMHRGGGRPRKGGNAKSYVPAEPEIVVEFDGDAVHLGMTGPVAFTRAEWVAWLRGELARTRQ